MLIHFILTVIFNNASTFGFKSELISCSLFHTFSENVQCFPKMFDQEILYKFLNYAL